MKKQIITAPAAPTLSVLQRRFLYLTAAVNGAAIMIVEILGAKMLAPYVGTSHFVWTAQIAVTMIALAAGYYVGGWMVDRSANLDRLYNPMIVAAGWLCLAVLVIEPVSYACLKFKLAMGTLLASMFLFFVPLALLAITGPFLIRVITSNVAGLGANVGRLTAISTLGSVAGTVLIGYFLIPFLPNSWTMYITAAVLVAMAIAYRLGWSRKAVGLPVLSGIAVLGLGYFAVWRDLHPDYKNMTELARVNSHFGMIQVFQDKYGPKRLYLNDFLVQNTYLTNEMKSGSMFTYMLHDLAQAYTPNIQNVLCIGLGVGIVPMEFARDGAKVDVVEINPAIIPIAQKFFNLDPGKLKIHLEDGRYYLNQNEQKYDAVILDAFLGDSCPSHLMTREAFTAIRRVLKPDGTLVINTFADFEDGKDFFAASLSKTLSAVFPSVRIHQRGAGNTLYVASSRSKLEIVHTPHFEHVHETERNAVAQTFAMLRETIPSHGRILTDDFNPVEFYDAANRESLRGYLARSFRKEIKGEDVEMDF